MLTGLVSWLETARRSTLVGVTVAILAAASLLVGSNARAQTGTCDLLSQDGLTTSGPFPTLGTEQEHCFGTYASSRWSSIVVRRFSDADSPGEYFQALAANSGWQQASGLGQRELDCNSGDSGCLWPGQTGTLVFQRGCYTVQGAWEAASEQTVRAELSRLDIRLQSVPCGGPAGTAPTPTSAGSSLGLACDTGALQSSGHVVCTAAMSNAQGDVSYAWTVDGKPQGTSGDVLMLDGLGAGAHLVSVRARDASGAQEGPQSTSFTRGGLAGLPPLPLGVVPAIIVVGGTVGATIAVAVLVRRGRRPPSPTRGPAKVPPGAPPPSSPETPLAGRAPPPASGPETLAPARSGPPASGPETLAPPPSVALPPGRTRRDRPRPQPTVSVRLILRPSILSQMLLDARTPQFLGDGVDFMIAGYELTVGPPGEWEVDGGARYREGDLRDQTPMSDAAVKPTWMVSCGSCRLLDELDKMADHLGSTVSVTDWRKQPLGPPSALSDAANVAIVAPWSEKGDSMSIAVSVDVRVKPCDGGSERQVVPGHAATGPDQRVPIIGALPRVTLTGATDRNQNDPSFVPQEGGTVTAEADGVCIVHVQPALYLFGQPYAGGLTVDVGDPLDLVLSPPSPPLGTVMLSELFEAAREGPHDPAQRLRSPEGLALRCRVRLDDTTLRRFPNGCPVQFGVHPTAYAFGADNWVGPYDWLLGLHYASCHQNYDGSHPSLPDPIRIVLSPSRIRIEAPTPERLPKTSTGDDRFVSLLKARLVSATDDPIDGKLLQRDFGPPTIPCSWRFQVRYDPPAEPWRQKIDKGCSDPLSLDTATAVMGLAQPGVVASGALALTDNPEDVGLVVFGTDPFYRYDHKERFEITLYRDKRSVDQDGQNKYICGQTCDVQVEFRATSDRGVTEPGGEVAWATFGGKSIHIDPIDQEMISCKIRVVAQSTDENGRVQPLAGAKVALSAMPPDRVVYLDDPDYPVVHCPDPTDADGIADFTFAPARMNPYQVSVIWQTNPQTEDYRASGDKPSRSPDDLSDWSGAAEPIAYPQRWATGHRKTALFTGLTISDGDTVTVVFPVSSEWAIQTDTTIALGANIKVLSFGGARMTAYLINRALMKSGDLAGSTVLELANGHRPSRVESRRWKRIALTGATFGASVSKAVVPIPLSVDVSDPGASPFRTKSPVAFEDFDGSGGSCWQAEVELGRGHSPSYVSFWGVTTRPKSIDVSSHTSGTVPNAGAGRIEGVWWVFDLDPD